MKKLDSLTKKILQVIALLSEVHDKEGKIPNKNATLIWKFAHIGLGSCNEQHKDWKQELDDIWKQARKERKI